MSMTFACFNIAKLEYQKFNIIGYFFSISYAYAWFAQKKNMQRKIKEKRSKCFIYDWKRVF